MSFIWFSFDCNIWTNPKVSKLADMLGLDIDSAVIRLARIWSWAMLAKSENGEVTHIPDDELSDIARWKKKPSVFVRSLISCGFIEEIDGRRFLHDWSDSNGKYLESLRKDRERKSKGNSTEIPRKFQRASEEIPRPTIPVPDIYNKSFYLSELHDAKVGENPVEIVVPMETEVERSEEDKPDFLKRYEESRKRIDVNVDGLMKLRQQRGDFDEEVL